MKINQKFAKKAVLAATLTAGVIGFNSMFNEAQATGDPPSYKVWDGKACSKSTLSQCAP